jgi:hypothetical protein
MITHQYALFAELSNFRHFSAQKLTFVKMLCHVAKVVAPVDQE